METNVIQLQRQGVSESLRASLGQYHIDLDRWQSSDEWQATATHTNEGGQCRTVLREKLSSLDAAKAWLIDELRKETGNKDLQFSEFTEAYMFYNQPTLDAFPRVASDKYVTCAIYESGSDTVRLVPENYCLIYFSPEGPVSFDVDAATVPYRAQIERAFAEYEKSHNQRGADEDNKGWLAWLLSEYIRRDFPGRKTQVLDSIIR